MAMFLILLCLISGLIVDSATREIPKYDMEMAEQLFEDFIEAYDRKYPHHVEKQKRFEIFKENLIIINQKNIIGGAVFAINKFADLTLEELELQYMGFKPIPFAERSQNPCHIVSDEDITTKNAPDSVNWVAKGAVTNVKNQAGCGSCWAFSTIGNIESQYFIKTNQLNRFSEQELVDCSKNNNGCDGGLMTTSLIDLMDIGGVELEASYPSSSDRNSCKFNSSKVVANVASCINYQLNDETRLKEIVATKGPVSIALNGFGVGTYTSGILNKTQCAENPKNHAVLIVGYGTDNGVDYWLIKNSWGEDFGEQGYFRMNRGDNTCGLMNMFMASASL